MTSHQPKLRSDLELREQVSAQGKVVVIKDPANGEFFRLQETEQFIAQQLDGETPLESVRSRAEEKFGAPLEPEALTGFIKTLDRNGLLETENGSPRQTGKRRRLKGSLLYLRFRLYDPERLFNRLIHRVEFFFTPWFVVLSACLMGTAVVVTGLNWSAIVQDASRLYSLTTLPLLIATMFIIVTAHEFAHGLTCKHFGGEVREMGFLLMYFQPALYCNVSDAWLFPRKSQRLWVGFAGPYFELFLWALATLVWRVTDTGTWINQVSLVVMAVSGIKTLFNFNPLIKLDGYYLLSDYLDIPNLRKKSFRYLGDFLRCLGGLARPLPAVPRRERRIFLTYGLIAWVFSVSFLSYAALLVGEYLIVEQQRLAFLAFTSIVGFRLRGRFRKLFGKSSNATDDPDDSGSAAPAQSPDSLTAEESESRKLGNATDEPAVTNDPKILSSPALHPPSPLLAAEERNGVGASPPDSAASPESETRAASPGAAPQSKPPKPDKKKRSVRKRLTKLAVRLLKLTAVSGAAAAVLFYGHMELRIAGAFNVLPVHNADVRAEVEGIVEDICVDEGDLVRQGDLIARLSDRDLKAELQKTEAQIDENRARLRLLEAGARPEEIQLAQYAVTRAEEQLKFARDRLGRDRQLYEQQLLSLNDYQESARQVASGSSDLADAKKKLDILLAGTRPEEIEAMKAQVTSLETQRRHLEDQLRLMRVVSPTTGIVTTPSRQLKEMKYQLVKKGDLIAKVHDIRTVTVEIVISEKEIGDVKVGQKVALKARAYPDVTFNGQVTSIATTARTGSSSGSPVSSSASATGGGATPKMVLVTTEIDNDSRLLKPEMTGRAKIYCGQRRLFDLVTRRLSRTLRVEFWSWW